MEAACRGAAEAGGRSLGVLVGGEPNRYVTEIVRAADLADRLRRLRDESAAAIFLPRGLGTMLELTWMAESIGKGIVPPRPLVFLGTFWRRAVALAVSEAAGPGAGTLAASIHFAPTGESAVDAAFGV